MRKLMIPLLMLLALSSFLGATATSKTYLTNYVVWEDAGLNATPADAYVTSTDAVISDKFPGYTICGKIVVAHAYIKEAVNGTSAHHVTPIIQVSGDGTTWTDYMTLEPYSSGAVTITTTWALVIDLREVMVPYIRIAYIIHTSAHATLANASTGDIRTRIYTKK